jgi:hypothetical protein
VGEIDVGDVGPVIARERPDAALVGLGESSEHAPRLIDKIVREAAWAVIVLLHQPPRRSSTVIWPGFGGVWFLGSAVVDRLFSQMSTVELKSAAERLEAHRRSRLACGTVLAGCAFIPGREQRGLRLRLGPHPVR